MCDLVYLRHMGRERVSRSTPFVTEYQAAVLTACVGSICVRYSATWTHYSITAFVLPRSNLLEAMPSNHYL